MRVEGLILAAGLSSRFTGYKMTHKIDNKTILQHCIDQMKDFVDKIYIVTGHMKEEIENMTKDDSMIECVYNENYLDGMFSSIKCGVKYLHCDKFFLTPGDYPYVLKSTYEILLQKNALIVLPSYQMKTGHPILLDQSIIDTLKDTVEPHLRAFLGNYEKTYVVVNDSGILKDIDTNNDIERKGGYDENHGSCESSRC